MRVLCVVRRTVVRFGTLSVPSSILVSAIVNRPTLYGVLSTPEYDFGRSFYASGDMTFYI